VSEAFRVWWDNPVTGLLAMLVLWLFLTAVAAGRAAVVRLGGIQLGGLLVERTDLIPGYPRRGDAYASIILFLGIAQGLVLVVFSVATVRAGSLAGLGTAITLIVLVLGWLLAVIVGLALARGDRVEGVATVSLRALRPFIPVLVRLTPPVDEDEDEEFDEDDAVDEHDIQAFIGAGEEAGILEHEDAELVASIVELSETVAREIMTPRTDVVAVPATADFDTVERCFAESMFTRLPVYRESLDHIEGVVHVKDALKASAAGQRPSAGELLRSVLVVPETKPLRELLREFQGTRQQLAVVVDEYGGTSGIVTLEDVLEEIVGEIQDEHQRERPEVEPEGDGVYLLDGGANVDVLEELFGVEVAEVGFDSVAGLVLDRLGHLPRRGEQVVWQGLTLEVVEVDRRRLRRVRVSGPQRRA
jgi:CBS domain containing-hemolysin-like protein